MNEILMVIILMAIFYFGLEILRRLPKSNNRNSFEFELPDERVTFEIDALTEKDFDISFVDTWNVGRSFIIGGKIVQSEDNVDKPKSDNLFGFQERCIVNVTPSADWFTKSSFGSIRTFKGDKSTINIWPPYQLSNRIFDEVRRNPNQLLTVGYKRQNTSSGKELLRVYSFELSEKI